MEQEQELVWVPLDFPLPNRNWIKGENGLWSSVPWTDETRRNAQFPNNGKWVPKDKNKA